MDLFSNTENELYTRGAWKFACENKISGTPTMWVNGVDYYPPNDESDWQAFLEEFGLLDTVDSQTKIH